MHIVQSLSERKLIICGSSKPTRPISHKNIKIWELPTFYAAKGNKRSVASEI